MVTSILTVCALTYFSYKVWNYAKDKFLAPQQPVKKEKKEQKTMKELLEPFEKKWRFHIFPYPDLTHEEIASDSRCLIGLKGRVFDASSNPMYAKGGSYDCFVGKDASVALAKMKFDEEFMDPNQTHWSQDLNTSELNILEDWLIKFESKYHLVGYIKNDRKLIKK